MNSTNPVAIALLAIAAVATAVPFAPATPSPASVAADLPTVDEIVANAFKAVGGEAAAREVKTLHAVFEMEFGGQKVIQETSWSRDGGRIVKTSMPGMGEMVQGTDGKVAWRKTAAGYSLLEDKEARQLDGQGNMYRMVLEPDHLTKDEAESVEVKGKETFTGKECYRVHFVNKEKQEGDVFFDAESGLVVGSRQTNQTLRGSQTSTMTLADWKETAGVKFFRTINVETQGAGMGPMALKATTLEVNTLGAEAFALPDEVKNLAEGRQPEPSGSPAVEIKLSDLSPDMQTQATQMIDGVKQSGNASIVQSTITGLEQTIPSSPEPQKKMLQYVVQELKKHQKTLGGGR